MSDSETAQSELTRQCPVCEGDMAATDTICGECRRELERQVMLVRAEDYPLPTRVVQNGVDAPEAPATGSVPLEEQLDSAVNADDEIDLLPLAPVEEFVRPSTVAVAPAPATTATATRATTVAAPARPPVAAPAQVSAPSSLQPHSRWKLAVIVLAITAVTAILAAIVWSLVVPSHSQPAGETAEPAIVTE